MTTRKAAKTVAATLSRQIEGSFVKTPPPAFYPMLAHPPPPSLTKEAPARPLQDMAQQPDLSTMKPTDRKKRKSTAEIEWTEDRFRDRFFNDHPFEAYRAKSLAERDQLQDAPGPSGLAWYQLRQRTRNPSPEDCIAFATNLCEAHGWPEAQAYLRAIQEYRTLRSEHETASRAARAQATALGARFFGEVEKGVRIEERALDAWSKYDQVQAGFVARGGNRMMPVNAASSLSSAAPTSGSMSTQNETSAFWGQLEEAGRPRTTDARRTTTEARAEAKASEEEKARQAIKRFRQKFAAVLPTPPVQASDTAPAEETVPAAVEKVE